METSEIRSATVAAIRSACKEIEAKFPGDAIAALGINTDDDVMTLFAFADVESSLKSRVDENPLQEFVFMDDMDDGISMAQHFDPICELVNAHCESDSSESRALYRFNELVAALNECRSAGVFPASTRLYCGSTDPSPEMLALELEAVALLNTNEYASRYKAFRS